MVSARMDIEELKFKLTSHLNKWWWSYSWFLVDLHTNSDDLRGLRQFRKNRNLMQITMFTSELQFNQLQYEKTEVGEFKDALSLVYRPILG